MTKKFRQLSLQAKMSSIFILVNLVVFAVTVILILGINSMSSEIDMVYQGNLRLNELSDALTAVQDSMTEYLDSKTSDSLEEFYRSEQIYAQMVQGLSDDVTEAAFRRMERSIRHMSEEYLDLVGQTIEAKRGRNVEKYREAGINWWDYCGSILVNSYPTYFEKLPPLIERINREKRNSKNYILFLGSTGTESNQAPCLSLVQFQIEQGELVMTAYQRSSDANLGLPADIYHLYLISRQIELPLKSITLNLGNVHIYENNIDKTEQLLAGNENVKFELNV